MHATIGSFVGLLGLSGMLIALAPAGAPRWWTTIVCTTIVLAELLGYIFGIMIPLWGAKKTGELKLAPWHRAVLVWALVEKLASKRDDASDFADLQYKLRKKPKYRVLCYLATVIWVQAHLYLVWTIIESIIRMIVSVSVATYGLAFPKPVRMFLSVRLWQPLHEILLKFGEEQNEGLDQLMSQMKIHAKVAKWLMIGSAVVAVTWFTTTYPLLALNAVEMLLLVVFGIGTLVTSVLNAGRFTSPTETKRNENLLIQSGWAALAIILGITLWLHYGGGQYSDLADKLGFYTIACIAYVVLNSAILITYGAITGSTKLCDWIEDRKAARPEPQIQDRPTIRIVVPSPVVEGARAVRSFVSDYYHGVCPQLRNVTVPID